MRTKIKFLDPLTISTIPLALAVFFGIVAIKTGNKNLWIAFLIIGILLIVLTYHLGVKATKEPGLILENDFDGKVRYKPEDGCEPKELENSKLPVAADGVNTGIKPGKVFKLRSGTNVYIAKNGNVRSYSPVSAWVNKWVSRSDFTAEELKCWEKLFDIKKGS